MPITLFRAAACATAACVALSALPASALAQSAGVPGVAATAGDGLAVPAGTGHGPDVRHNSRRVRESDGVTVLRAGQSRPALPSLTAAALHGPAWRHAPALTAGAATGTITGTLTDSSGTPVAGADVAAINAATQSESGGEKTDDAGHFQLTVTAGRYWVAFRHHGLVQLVPQADPGQAIDANLYPVSDGKDITVNETLRPAGLVSGRITTAAAAPSAGTVVAAFALGAYTPAATAESGADGTYRLPLHVGAYHLFMLPKNQIGQWTHAQESETKATLTTVTDRGTSTVDEQLLGTGKVSGRLLNPTRKPLVKAQVQVESVVEERFARQVITTTTNAKGNYSFAAVPAGTYRVRFQPAGSSRWQYAPGKSTVNAGKKITVAVGKSVTVNDTRIAGGTVVLSAVNSKTGKPTKGICAGPVDSDMIMLECAKGNTLTASDVAPGKLRFSVEAGEDELYWSTYVTTTVRPGKTVKAVAKLQTSGGILATVTDRKTKRPVADAAIEAVPTGPRYGNGFGTTSSNGRATLPLGDGRYQLYVRLPADVNEHRYGRQWVGPKGGTGQRKLAAVITIKAGKAVKAPPILLDRAGTIAGTVTNPDGTANPHVVVSPQSYDYAWGTQEIGLTDINGGYELTDFGPYAWPVLATPRAGYPRQWSGGGITDLGATTTTVSSGKVATLNLALKAGIRLRGAISGVPSDLFAITFVTAFNAKTDEPLGFALLARGATSYDMPILGNQPVKLSWTVMRGTNQSEGWYGGKDYEHAGTVQLPATGEKAINLKIK